MSNIYKKKRSPLWSGIPFITTIIGGSFFIYFILSPKFEILTHKSISERKFNLEEEHKKTLAKLNIDDYKLSRIPRINEREKEKEKKELK